MQLSFFFVFPRPQFLSVLCHQPEPEPQDLSHETVDDWELPKEEFTLEEQLGKGFFADVYRGNWKGIVNVAIKILKKNGRLAACILVICFMTFNLIDFNFSLCAYNRLCIH